MKIWKKANAGYTEKSYSRLMAYQITMSVRIRALKESLKQQSTSKEKNQTHRGITVKT